MDTGKTASLLVTLTFLAGCACDPRTVTVVETKEVTVPVPVRPEPPAALTAPLYEKPPQIFVPLNTDGAAMAVTADGLEQYQDLIDRLVNRLEAWKVWSEKESNQ